MHDANRRIDTASKPTNTEQVKQFWSSIVPKSFMLGGLRINVTLDDALASTKGIIGEARYAQQAILIDHTVAPQQTVEQAFLHELTHWIFFVMNEDELKNNEKLVDLFAHFLYQALSTAEPLPEPAVEHPEGE